MAIVYEASGSVTNIATGAIPCAVAVNSATNRVYVVNHGDDSVTVVDAAMREVIATVKVGSLPQGIAVDTKANRIYVANVHGDSISVIDGSSNRVVKTLSTGKNPYAIAVDQAGNAYITGRTNSSDFPLTNPIQTTRIAFDIFVTEINAAVAKLPLKVFENKSGRRRNPR